MSTTMDRAYEKRIIIELPRNDSNTLFSVTFVENERHILCGSQNGVLRIDRDAKVKATPEASNPVYAIAVSKDGRWIITGELGKGVIWDAKTFRKAYEMKDHNNRKRCVSAVDISDDSTKAASGSDDKTVLVFSIASGQRTFGPILHDNFVVGVKFSPDGERIATAAVNCGVRVFDFCTGLQLFDITIPVDRNPSTPIAWSADNLKLFVVSPGKLVCLDPSQNDSSNLEWVIPNTDSPVSIVNSGRFLACSAGSCVSFWDTNSHKQLGHPVVHSATIGCLAISSDGRYLVCGTKDQKIVVHDLHETLAEQCFTVNLPLMQMSEATVQSWVQDSLVNTEALLSEEIARHPSNHAFANRALTRTRLKQWNAVIEDARKSLNIKPSPIGHIALALALIGQGKREEGLWAFDLSFRDCDRNENKFVLLIKSILLYLSGNHKDAILRAHDLVLVEDDSMTCCCTLVLASMYLSTAYYEDAIQWFRRAQHVRTPHASPFLITISLIFGEPFDLMGNSAQRRACKALLDSGYTKEAAEICLWVANVLREEARTSQVTTKWFTEVTRRCILACEYDGDIAFKSDKLDKAMAQYTTALSLNPPVSVHLFVKRSKVQATLGLWDDALRDAHQAIEMDPSCPRGYERRHAALYDSQRYDEAIGAYSDFLSAVENSHDPEFRQLRQTCMSPEQITLAINEEISKLMKTCPFVLINVESGRLYLREERVRVFEQSQAFKKLISSVTSNSDCAHIAHAVVAYFQYVMFSHTWDGEEPSFLDVDVSMCPPRAKLRRFCEEVRRLGYVWAWSDTCCIDKGTSSESVVNQSLALMYHWYENSAATLVLLADVEAPLTGQKTNWMLTRSRWMTRAWTLQELLVPRVVRFYDRNWNPYLGDSRANHKEPGAITDELARQMDIPRGTLTAFPFRPNCLTVREKLRLASKRKAREEEDEAYALIGVFESDVRPKYGERKAALGNLLQEIVDRTGDVAGVLAWAHGPALPFNSCLPVSLAVYSRPPFITEIQIGLPEEIMDERVAELRARVARNRVLEVCDAIVRLPPPRFGNRRLHLPCVVFPLEALQVDSGTREILPWHSSELDTEGVDPPRVYAYRAQVRGLGSVEFTTTDDLLSPQLGNDGGASQCLVFVHPWIREVRGPWHHASGEALRRHLNSWGRESEPPAAFKSSASAGSCASSERVDTVDQASERSGIDMSTSTTSPASDEWMYTQALRLVVRLGQPFNALVLAQQPNHGKFRRVATDNEIRCCITSFEGIYSGVLEIL